MSGLSTYDLVAATLALEDQMQRHLAIFESEAEAARILTPQEFAVRCELIGLRRERIQRFRTAVDAAR